MDFESLHGFGANPVPLADKQSLIDNYNAGVPAMSDKLGYQVTYSDPVPCNVADATVVASAYNTSGNGGRKLVRLNNGMLVGIVRNSTTQLILYKSTDNGLTWSIFYTLNSAGIVDCSLVTNGTFVYVLYTANNTYVSCYVFKSDGSLFTNNDITSSETAVGSTSLAINSYSTELHACWSSKNATYANSFNIRYAKGTINGDGSVSWGSITQITTQNISTADYTNPSIILNANGSPVIIACYNYATTGNHVYAFAYNGSSFTVVAVYDNNGHAQSNPSAIFVPQSVNGLANGRIWVAWHGTDSTDTTYSNIRVSYSDDGGTTWSAMVKLTNGNVYNQRFPSITVNSSNKIFIIFDGGSASTAYFDVKQVTYDGVWSSVSVIKQGLSTTNYAQYPSTLFDPEIDFTVPLFIYQNYNSKVGFYGTWNDVIKTESINYALVNLKNLIETVNSSGRLGQYVNKRWASGSATGVGGTPSYWHITVSGLTFTPKYILIFQGNGNVPHTIYNADNSISTFLVLNTGNGTAYSLSPDWYINATGFQLMLSNNGTWNWIAIE